MTNAYWLKICPLCDGQGRLLVYKYRDNGDLFLCCDECMACWSSVEDVELCRNTFREFNIKAEYQLASYHDIEMKGWNVSELKVYER